MPDEIIQFGSKNLVFKNIYDSNFNIYLDSSPEYRLLRDELDKELGLLFNTPDENEAEQKKIKDRVREIKTKIDELKSGALQLTQQYNRIKVNTGRLKAVKEAIEKGEFREVRAILERAKQQMEGEQEALLKEKEYFENDVTQALKNNSEEFLIFALTMKADTSGPESYEEINNYFRRSIISNPDKFNILEYSLFLQENNRFEEAERLRQAANVFQGPDLDETRIILELDRLSWNYFWSWDNEGGNLWRTLDPTLWERCEQNPRLFLKNISHLRLLTEASNDEFLAKLTGFSQKLEEYLTRQYVSFEKITASSPVAYFSAEYGVHNSLPNYSGGLGILSGDYLKSASDMGVPVVAVGLLYRFGYFRQSIGLDGWQRESYVDNSGQEPPSQALDPSQDLLEYGYPVVPILDEDGNRLTISLKIDGRDVYVRAWLASIGRTSLYLLDTNVEENGAIDQLITGHLYGGDSKSRIAQEMVLGIGGVRLLRKLNIKPAIYHLNEGHTAFSTLEVARGYLEDNPGKTFGDAMSYVRSKCVFTIHSSVPVTNDAFPPDLLFSFFDHEYLGSLKLKESEFLALGRNNVKDNANRFWMTPLAIRMCGLTNGLSRKHGEILRELWKEIFPETEIDGIPITFITTGVHPSTWIAPTLQNVFEKYIGANWLEVLGNGAEWQEQVNKIPETEIWNAHKAAKNLLISFIREKTSKRSDFASTPVLNPDALTIGFAHPVMADKRWDLLIYNLDRLMKVIGDENRPVQFVFAGKAHPQDRAAKLILQKLISIYPRSRWDNYAIFLEDYDQAVARYLVQGVDVWLNVSRGSLESSGTSGQKAAMNGVLNLSTLAGWWIEGYDGENGFAIPSGESFNGDALTDDEDSELLYEVLQNEVIPAYFTRDEDGIRNVWVQKMKNALSTLTPRFSSDRMLENYIDRIYRDRRA